ncbi:MAG: HlyC/CorC family transporter [Verrucomicrobia bacterium]|nr:HlyC/CorC family transporter [Verrucomicrobiota bacterium]
MSVMELIALLLCVALSFCFSGIETGLLSLNKIRLRHHARRHDPRALMLQGFLERPDRFLATVLVGNTLVNAIATVIAAGAAVRHWPGLGLPLTIAVMTFVLLVVGELMPKSLFRIHPFRSSMMLAMPLRWCAVVMKPLTVTFGALAGALMRLAGEARDRKELFVTREELLLLAREGELGQKLSAEERTMIAGVFEMCATPVRDVMLPMAQVLAVTPQTSAAEVLRQVRERDVARLPVLDAAGQLLGVADVYDILCSDADTTAKTAADFSRPAPIVDAAEPLDRALARLRALGAPMAVVVDAKKHPLGVVTLSDLVEKIVGEIVL